MDFFYHIEQTHPAPFDGITEPTINFEAYADTTKFPQMTGLGANQRRYYIDTINGNNWTPVPGGTLSTNSRPNGSYKLKIEWENNGILDANAQSTTTTIERTFSIVNSTYNPNPVPPTPIISQLNQFNNPVVCSNAGILTGKLANPTGTVTVKHNNISIPYNAIDSSFTYNPA